MPPQGYDAINQHDSEEGVPDVMSESFTSVGETRRRRRSSVAKVLMGFRGEASWISCVVNLLNTIIGAGVLAMPGAMSKFGMTLGIFVILFCGCTSGFALYLQSRCARYIERGNASFFSLSLLTYPNASVIFDGAIVIKCFGVGVSYLIVIGNLMPLVVQGLFDSPSWMLDRHFWVTVCVLIIIPVSFLRRLDSLKYTSFIALVSIGYLLIIVLSHYFKGDTLQDRGEVLYFQWAGAIPALSSFPIMVFAYTCHQNMFPILNEIHNNSHKSTSGVIGGSIGTAAFLYILVAVTGYLSYGDHVNGNIISMYPPSISSTIGRLAIVIMVMFSHPLQLHPCRASIDNVLKWKPQKKTMMPLVAPAPRVSREAGNMSDARFTIITSVILISSYIVAMSVGSLERVLAYVGSTGSTTISFILPGLFYWKISDPALDHFVYKIDGDTGEEFYNIQDSWQNKWLRRGSLALVVWGFLVMAVCLGLNISYSAGGH